MITDRLTAAAFIGCIVLCGCNDTFDASATKPSAETIRQYVNKGWLPHGVPDTMKSLKVSGDLDAERDTGTFTSDATDTFLKTCHLDADGFAIESALPKWFPKEVREANSSDQLRHMGYAMYECEDDFAVIRKGTDKTVWFWSDREDDD